MSAGHKAWFFLKRLRPIVDEGRLVFVDREKNRKFLADNDLTFRDVVEEIKKLEPGNYYRGPEADDDGSPGDIMTFMCRFCDGPRMEPTTGSSYRFMRKDNSNER